MDSATSIAASGLSAIATWMETAASNIANARDTFPLTAASGPTTAAAAGQVVPFQPMTVALSADSAGPVTASVMPAHPSYLVAYDPTLPFANAQGLVGMANVDLPSQFMAQALAMASYRANLAVMQTANQMTQTAIKAVG